MTGKRIAYVKIGRSWNLDPRNGTVTGGDADVGRALHTLSRMRPDDEFLLLSANSCEDPADALYPDNVKNIWATDVNEQRKAYAKSNRQRQEGGAMTKDTVAKMLEFYDATVVPMYDKVDEIIVWAGQHGTSNMPLPSVKDRSVLTVPQDAFVLYCSHILNGINRWRDVDPASREEMWLCPDPRNYLKARDVKWPLQNSIIAQFEQTRTTKHERFGDSTLPSKGVEWGEIGGVWVAKSKYTYDALELTALPSPARIPRITVPWDQRFPFGMVVNENRAYVAKSRSDALTEYVLPFWPQAEIFGKWTQASMEKIGRTDIRSCPYEYLGPTLQRWRSTLTTPASGSGWATAKPWECFAYGTVCFFHPDYDTQGHILRDIAPDVRDFLRVKSPEQLRERVTQLDTDQTMWTHIVRTQRDHYEAKYDQHLGGVAEIQRRLG